MAHGIIMRAFERSSPHNMLLHSRFESMENFNKIQQVFQRLEKSCVDAATCFKEDDNNGEETKQENDAKEATNRRQVISLSVSERSHEQKNLERELEKASDTKGNKENIPHHHLREELSMTGRGVRAFKRWMMDNGIEYSNSLSLCIDEGSVSCIGVRVVVDLKEGDVIATIPKKACLTNRTSVAGHMREKAELGGALGLAVAFMYERSKGTNSPCYVYLQLLPHQECVPLVWTVNEVDTLLTGTELHKVVEEDMKLFHEDWKESIASLTALHPIQFPRDWFSNERYFAAKTTVGSCAFEIDDYHGFGMVPLADLFNHKTAAEDVHFTSVPIDYSTEIDNPEASYSDEECNTTSCSDISDCVHSEADTGLSQSLNGNDNDDLKGTCFSSAGEVLEMILVKDVKEGSEVSIHMVP